MQEADWSNIGWYNIAAFGWFIFLWLGYARFARYQAKRSNKNLSSVMNHLRKQWMNQLIKRDMRIPDAALIANLERNVTFLASSSILVLAGLLTALASTDKIQAVLVDVPFHMGSTSFLLHIKFFVLILIYAYAFFTFSWSMRQYGFATVVIGAAPLKEEVEEDPDCAKDFIRASAKVIDMAAHTYNYGLRAYYFSLSVLAWFINVWFFVAASTLVVIVLYLREFHSRPLRELRLLQ
ncbi:MAG: DUF599 domain-containing protein [Cellvibrionaceae bacterium]